MLKTLVATLATTLCASAWAVPFTLEYIETETAQGWRYDFSLLLDDADGAWSKGDGYNLFVLADVPVGESPLHDFRFVSVPSTFAPSVTAGSHNGPSLISFVNDFQGWVPDQVGDSLRWSGVSARWAGSELSWGALFLNGAKEAPWYNDRFVARHVTEFTEVPTTPVPEPSSLALLATGLLCIGAVAKARSLANALA